MVLFCCIFAEHFQPLLEQISKLEEALYNIQFEQHWLEAQTDRQAISMFKIFSLFCYLIDVRSAFFTFSFLFLCLDFTNHTYLSFFGSSVLLVGHFIGFKLNKRCCIARFSYYLNCQKLLNL